MSEHIVLTGATGAIGLPLTARLLSRPTLERLTAIVREPKRRRCQSSSKESIVQRILPS